jgi:transcriptional regulator with XRE-family HTH domain
MMSGRLIAAARSLTSISQDDLASAAGISTAELARLEASDAAVLPSDPTTETIRKALEHFGAVFIAEGDGMGAGVRLKFSRLDTRQISRLENEGGPVGDDDVP